MISALTIVAKNISNSEGRLVPFIPRGSFSEKTEQIRTEGRHLDNLNDLGPDFLPSKHRTFFQIHIEKENM